MKDNIPENTTCSKCKHILEGCDEYCNSCGRCYMKYNRELCNKTCEHSKHEDDGGFLIDGNHPDDMFGLNNTK